MAIILGGKAMAETIRAKIKDRVVGLKSKPGLAILLVGDDPASHTYVALKQKACEQVGIHFEKHEFDEDVSEIELLETIEQLNTRSDIHGILIQLPLPNQDPNPLIDAIDPLKDVDGFHPHNLEQLRQGLPSIASAVALGILKLIDAALSHQPRSTKHAVIVASNLFAEPIKILLLEQQIDSIVIQPDDPTFLTKTQTADILIVAVGKPGLITSKHVKHGAIVIDVGTTKVDSLIVGDVDFDSVEPIAYAISPVPGGVGPMTVAMLMLNVLKAYQLQNRQRD